MRILIIEDEILAGNRLKSLINNFNPEFEIIDLLDSVKSSVKWLNKNQAVDLIFMDIQLGDGLSFEIFEYCEINCPIIFTTAYDQYALQAFKVNSIDYLLKPFDKEDLAKAFDKLKQLRATDASPRLSGIAIQELVQALGKTYKSRFIIKVGEQLHSIAVNEIAFFFSKEKATFIQTNDNKRFVIDYSLDQLTEMVDPKQFFRINRKYLICINAIDAMKNYSNSRLIIKLKGPGTEDVIVSREKVNNFKSWLDR